MPAETPRSVRDEYKAAATALSRTLTGRKDREEVLLRRHRSDVAAVRQGVAEALTARDAAQRAAVEAEATAEEIDRRAVGLWRDLLRYVGSGRIPPRLREVPDRSPRASIGASAADRGRALPEPRVEDPAAVLERARRTLHRARRGQLEYTPPHYLVPLMAVIGAVCAFAAVLAAQAVLGAAGPGDGNAAMALRPVALLCVFLGPFIGLPAASWYLGWRHRQRPRPQHVWALIGAGVLALVVAVPLVMV